jgi:hypothetical protein
MELAAGVGLVFQPQLGLKGAAALWLAVFPAALIGARRGSGRWSGPLACTAGASLAATLIHYTLWPWRIRGGVPWLEDAEGLSDRLLPWYNALLVLWFAAAAGAVAAEVPREQRAWAVAGFLSALPFRRSARHHFIWIHEQSKRRPSWWNRGVRSRNDR